MKEKLKEGKGITLIALVITIIVLLILAGVSISMLTGSNGILTQAQRASISTELAGCKEQVELFKQGKYMEDSSFLDESLTAGKENLFYNTQQSGEEGNIKTIIKNISDEYLEKLEIIKGELLINTQDRNEIEVAQSLGIQVNPYDIVDGVLLSSNGNLLLMDDNGTVTIPDSVTEIGEGAFANLNGLKTIIIPGTVKRIGANAFAYNTTLENVIMQEGVEEIGNSAFQSCTNLKNVELPDSLTTIERMAFYGCYNLQKIEIPSKVKVITEYLFDGCSNLSEVILTEGLEQISLYAFRNTSFSKIEIPSTVTDIGNSVFTENKNLNNIVIKGDCPYVYESGMLMPKEKDGILFISDSYLRNITTFNIPEGIRNFNVNINSYNNITKIVIPSTLQNINNDYLPTTISNIEISGNNSKFAVSDEDKILYTKDTKELVSCFSKEETINLKDEENSLGLLSLSGFSFKQATNAKTIILPDSLTNIGPQVFNNCKNIEEIRIGTNVSYIDPIFKYTNYSGVVTIDSGNNSYMVENNVLYSKNKKTLVCVLSQITGRFEIEDGVEVIGDRAFHNQNGMTEVVIPDSVKEIGVSFNYCRSLTSIEIPSSVENINISCFLNSQNLDRIMVNKGENEIAGAPWGATKGMKVVEWKE